MILSELPKVTPTKKLLHGVISDAGVIGQLPILTESIVQLTVLGELHRPEIDVQNGVVHPSYLKYNARTLQLKGRKVAEV